jgi:DNA-binding response OmpR family regulator
VYTLGISDARRQGPAESLAGEMGFFMQRILLIEDDKRIHKTLKLLFESEGYSLEVALDGPSGLEAFRSARPSVVILDLKLPGMSGRDVLLEIRKEVASQPVIILSALSEEVDKVLLLELGADDYVTKPFSPKELLARVRALTRRAERTLPAAGYSFGDIVVDFAKMEVTRDGVPVMLTPHEFKTLRYFTQNPERVLSRDELLNQVWGYECYPSTRTVDNHILRLRQKLERDPVNPLHFRTIHKVGYKFVPSLKAPDND